MGHWERSRENWILLKEYLSEEEKEIRANKEVRIASTMDPCLWTGISIVWWVA